MTLKSCKQCGILTKYLYKVKEPQLLRTEKPTYKQVCACYYEKREKPTIIKGLAPPLA